MTPRPAGLMPRRKFERDVLWGMAALGVLGVSGIVMNLLIARWAGPGALGVFNQVYAAYIVLSQVAVGGVQFSVLRHVSEARDDPARCAAMTTGAVLALAPLAALAGLATALLAGPAGALLDSPEVATGLRLAAPGLVCFVLNKALLMVLNGTRRMRAYALLQSLRYVLMLAVIAALLALGRPAAQLGASFTVAEVVVLAAVLAYLPRQLFRLAPVASGWPWARTHLGFGARGALSGVLGELNTRVDVLMLGYFLKDAAVGVYSFAAILAEGFGQLSYVVRQNVDPLLAKPLAAGETEAVSAIAGRVRRVFVPGMAAVGAAAALLYGPALGLLGLHVEFGASRGVFWVLAEGVVVNAFYRPFLGLLLQGGRPGAHTLLVGGTVLANVVLNAALIPSFGPLGAAAATAAALVAEGLLLKGFARRLLGVRL